MQISAKTLTATLATTLTLTFWTWNQKAFGHSVENYYHAKFQVIPIKGLPFIVHYLPKKQHK